jgi:type II restriction enzyme
MGSIKMNLFLANELADAYKSGAQRTRVITEAWGGENLYCPNCISPKVDRLPHNTRTIDFSCPSCDSRFQLKGSKSRIGKQVTDGAYGTMMEAIREDRTPNFYFLHYNLATWTIQNLLLIPHFAFPVSAIIKRKPLSASARRAGWVGCNFALDRIPIDARIPLVANQTVIPPDQVRARFRKVKPLQDIEVKQRGWTLDVLNLVRRLGKPQFSNSDVYAFERELEKLHPDNRHIKEKIRQQLQVLRDAGFLRSEERGIWNC